ncbi:hypothetical protein M5K25_022618 [Dendrobium thyrsiflorum]|uniref:RNase H type-1 domain-containing protein n=1 Tax=Dendrobium thyrsiflorum TaxID=117978 RepID=A0ABD0U6H8_DENTH
MGPQVSNMGEDLTTPAQKDNLVSVTLVNSGSSPLLGSKINKDPQGILNVTKDLPNIDEFVAFTSDFNTFVPSPTLSFPDLELFRKNIGSDSTYSFSVVHSEREKVFQDNVVAPQCDLGNPVLALSCAAGAMIQDEVNLLDEGMGAGGKMVSEGNSVVLEEGELDQGSLVVDLPIKHAGMQIDNHFSVNEHYLNDVYTDTEDMDVQANYVAFESSFSKNRSSRDLLQLNLFNVQLSIVGMLKLWFVDYKGHIRNIIPSLILWYLWMERNNSHFNGIAMCHLRIIQKVIHKIGALYSANLISGDSFKNYLFSMDAFGIDLPMANVQRMPRAVVWLKPLVNYFKLNVDTVTVNSVWGCGGLIWESNGDFIFGFAGPSPISDVKFAINYTILYGLNIFLSLGINNVVIEVSSNLFGNSFIWLDTTEFCSPNLFYMRRDIINLLTKLNCDFSKVNAKGNVCANVISIWGCDLDSMVDLITPQLSNQITGLIALDKIGLPYVS